MTSWSWISWGMKNQRCSSLSATRTPPTTFWLPSLFRRCSTFCVNGLTIPMAGVCPTMCGLWDEAANTGQVPGLEKIVAVIRSREISLTLFYQAMSQCKALYKDHSETIMGNMDSIVFLGGREASTLKDISENWLGKATISMQTEGRSRGQSESYSQNMQRLGRELMTTSEITTMPGDKCILQLRGLPPFLSPKYDLKKHPNYKYTAEFDKKKNAFRLESLFRHRPLRLKPEDEYTVYEVDGSDTDEEADLLNFDDLDSDEFV